MQSAFDYIIIGLIVILVLFLIKPEWYDSTARKLIDAGKDKFNNTETNSTTIQDLGLPYTYENFSFILCTSNNICERLYGTLAYCNLTDGHCYKNT